MAKEVCKSKQFSKVQKIKNEAVKQKLKYDENKKRTENHNSKKIINEKKCENGEHERAL